MNVRTSYDLWSEQYDTNQNKTRDLEAQVLKQTLANRTFFNVLEVGCGTGKNTEWMVHSCDNITAVDLSAKMLARAQEKVHSEKVTFRQVDINNAWTFTDGKYDLITFSLVLEHIELLDPIFQKVSDSIGEGGYVYIGELHPFRQYKGSKARFETEEGTHTVSCYTHHISDFVQVALKYNFRIEALNEHFDKGNRNKFPRIFSLLLRKT